MSFNRQFNIHPSYQIGKEMKNTIGRVAVIPHVIPPRIGYPKPMLPTPISNLERRK